MASLTSLLRYPDKLAVSLSSPVVTLDKLKFTPSLCPLLYSTSTRYKPTTHTQTQIHTYTHTHKQAHTHTHKHKHTYTQSHTNTHTHTQTNKHMRLRLQNRKLLRSIHLLLIFIAPARSEAPDEKRVCRRAPDESSALPN